MKEKITSMGAIASALFASVCCLGPIVLVGLGLGGVGLAAGLERYRPFFLGLTTLFLGLAFYFTYRKREVTCVDGSCKLESGGKTKKSALWVITVAALGTATFPNWSALLLTKPTSIIVTDAHAAIVKLAVSGMTCSACAVGIEKSLNQVPGVKSSSVSLDRAEAVIYVEKDQVSTEKLIRAVQSAGSYSAEVKKTN